MAKSEPNEKNVPPLAIFSSVAHNRVIQPCCSLGFPGGLLMSLADESRLETAVGGRHSAGCQCHFPVASQEDRIRKVFKLVGDAPLPSVSDRALATYYDYLTATLALPFEALYCPTGGEMRQLIHYVRVTELANPQQSRMRNLHGLFCMAQNSKTVLELPLDELGVREENPNCQLLDDYAYWFVNWRVVCNSPLLLAERQGVRGWGPHTQRNRFPHAGCPHPNPLPKGEGTCFPHAGCPHPNPLPKGKGTFIVGRWPTLQTTAWRDIARRSWRQR